LSNQRTSDAPCLLSRYRCTLQLQNGMQMIQNTCRSTWLTPLSMKTKEAKCQEEFLLFRMTVLMHSPNIVQNSSIFWSCIQVCPLLSSTNEDCQSTSLLNCNCN
jgi:hypothetical protein